MDEANRMRMNMTPFDEWLEEKEENILAIRSRLGLLKPLERMLNGQSFKNDLVYLMVLDSYEMIVIDLASFFRGLLQKGGPGLNQLNNHLSRLKRGKPPVDPSGSRNAEEWMNRHRAQEIYDSRLQAFERLFPDCTGPYPQQSDVRKLKARLDRLSESCVSARDSFHAHRYEKKKKTGRPLTLPEIESLFVDVQSMFNDLRLVALEGHFGYGDIPEEDQIAMDLRDIILHGTIGAFCNKLGLGDGRVSDRYYWQLRDEFYTGETNE